MRPANGACVDTGKLDEAPMNALRNLFCLENLYALLLCLLLIALIILTADQSPQWIYQGF